jgi:hypothetical protein
MPSRTPFSPLAGKPDKTIVWTHRDPATPSIHHFQILDTNGTPIEGRPLR